MEDHRQSAPRCRLRRLEPSGRRVAAGPAHAKDAIEALPKNDRASPADKGIREHRWAIPRE